MTTTRTAMIVTTHLLGVGHLARAAAIARGLVAEGWRVTLVSGGRHAPTVEVSGFDFVQLPPIHCRSGDFRTLYRDDDVIADDDFMASRREALLAAYERARPDVLTTELFPFGRRRLRAEFEALLVRAQAADDAPAILSSVRDVLQPPANEKRADEVDAILARFYDGVLWHGRTDIVPLAASWPVKPSLRRRLLATGYVRDEAPASRAGDDESATSDVIVSAGGSDAGALLLSAAVEAARRTRELNWRILVGHGVADPAFLAMKAGAPANAVVERARRDFPALLARARVSISMAGYNTILDLAAAKARAILAPYAGQGEQEQTIRAAALAERGLARIVEETALSPERLAGEAQSVMTAPRPDWSAFQLDGARSTAAHVAAASAAARAKAAAWRRLEDALGSLLAEGRTAPVWIRDDDAIEETPQLARWLEILATDEIPVALAAIPSRLSATLVATLKSFPRAAMIAHGWAHANHAQDGARKSEYPATRERAAAQREFTDGFKRMHEMAGTRFAPVFAAPWNRMAPNLEADLERSGYRGVSLFRRARAALPGAGLMRADTHWDPIAWRDGGGLGDEVQLLDQLASLVEQQRQPDADQLEPIGLLTHHLVHDSWIDAFMRRTLALLASSGAVRFLDAREFFRPDGKRDEARRPISMKRR